jgi:hypothetical protein
LKMLGARFLLSGVAPTQRKRFEPANGDPKKKRFEPAVRTDMT